jgi:hypothetical protein
MVIFLVVFMSGCVTGGYGTADFVPIPVPAYDESIRSAEYYKQTYNYDCLAANHSMSDEIRTANDAARLGNKVVSKISIMGVTPKFTPDVRLYTKSKKIGDNEYVITCDGLVKMQKQIAPYACWAACSQYIIDKKFGVSVDQARILEKIKPGIDVGSPEIAANVVDIVRTMGFSGLKYTKGGSLHLLRALASNNPVIIGLLPGKDNPLPHAVVVVGARYSFARTAEPSCMQCSQAAFLEFFILDPSDGELHEVPAAEYDGRIYSVLSYFYT